MSKYVNRLLLFINITVLVLVSVLAYSVSRSRPAVKNIRPQNDLTVAGFVEVKLSRMSNEEKQGILFMVSIPDKILTNSTAKYLRDSHIGGVILMGNNIESASQLARLTDDLRGKVDPHLIIAVDQEGGTVVRIPWDKYASISARETGNKNDLTYTKEIAEYRSKFLMNLGINTILGPVCDIGGETSFMYSRSFGSSQSKVTEQVATITQTQSKTGIITVLKHFPGHGQTSTDSHYEFPIIRMSKSDLIATELGPFRAGIENNAEFVMIGHVINPEIDSKPASLSKKYVEILENELKFNGVVITDDLKMTGKIEGGIGWGINLIVDTPQNVKTRMRQIEPEDEYVKRILELKYEKL